MTTFTFGIDPGHGGQSTGMFMPDFGYEKIYTMQLTDQLTRALKWLPLQIEMSRHI